MIAPVTPMSLDPHRSSMDTSGGKMPPSLSAARGWANLSELFNMRWLPSTTRELDGRCRVDHCRTSWFPKVRF